MLVSTPGRMSTLRQMAKTAQVAAAAPTPRSSAKLTRWVRVRVRVRVRVKIGVPVRVTRTLTRTLSPEY